MKETERYEYIFRIAERLPYLTRWQLFKLWLFVTGIHISRKIQNHGRAYLLRALIGITVSLAAFTLARVLQ